MQPAFHVRSCRVLTPQRVHGPLLINIDNAYQLRKNRHAIQVSGAQPGLISDNRVKR